MSNTQTGGLIVALEGVTKATPLPINSAVRYQTLTTTPLVGNAVFTSAAIDIGATPSDGAIMRITVYADQTGTVAVDESDDGTTWYQKFSGSVGAASFLQSSLNNCGRYQRVRVTNGATDQTKFRVAVGF